MNFTVEKLEELFPLADFLSSCLGPNSEVVIHDISDLTHSLIYAKNAHLSGRKIGDSMTDYALKAIKNAQYLDQSFLSNYYAKSINSRKFKSSTFFIKNSANQLIGLLCVNTDISIYEKLKNTIDDLIQLPALTDTESNNSTTVELLSGDPTATISEITQNVLSKYTVDVARLTKEEKTAIVMELNDAGVFLMKGAVPCVAQQLELSVPTLYRYLKQINQ